MDQLHTANKVCGGCCAISSNTVDTESSVSPIGENKGEDQLRSTAKLISAFVFATRIVHVQFLYFLNKNQRTNGPVNAHLRPEIYTCTNKLVRLEWYNACI